MEQKLGRKENLEKAAKCERRKRPSTPSKRGETFSSEYEHLKKKKTLVDCTQQVGGCETSFASETLPKEKPFLAVFDGTSFSRDGGKRKEILISKAQPERKVSSSEERWQEGGKRERERERGGGDKILKRKC